MTAGYRPDEPKPETRLPALLQDCLRLGHLAYFIGDTVESFDLKAFCLPNIVAAALSNHANHTNLGHFGCLVGGRRCGRPAC
ncbi:hypothetical protein [Roseateles sp.]|uniref:hypothetical protein n=1 Tax=Roseateles sp. TaxID=1971397 RepID=UPI00286AA557|nr:hypothetical protein [Roseateles sp.]